ncbi:MAG: hypothetical protein GTO14_11010 [Anaerolineales bacterium]|nr:hypothetical protein [Anaerolineales bacterium]
MKAKRFLMTATLAVVVVALCAAVLPIGQAYAQSGGGTGTLRAWGDGLAAVRGNGTIVISGNGILWIRDHNGDASIHITGTGVRKELDTGWIRYVGFNGQAKVTGSRVTVALSGYDIKLVATGTGKFVLRGNGRWETDNASGEWSSTAEVMSFP